MSRSHPCRANLFGADVPICTVWDVGAERSIVFRDAIEEAPGTAEGGRDEPASAALAIGDLPIGRVVGPGDVAALAVHIMTNTALTGATFDIDGGQQFVF
ncbi:hypothetical protein [Dactylosporangium salmoneum]|uniref:SDR family oxidoreductase n=1 Tax=Dactylosporangium salmoneum TaxID=53361 RepID=A0ABN3HGB1_9ACTN